MSMPFKYAGEQSAIDHIARLVDRLENLAYQAELGWWDAARAEWRALGRVTHAPRGIADAIVAGAEPLCNEILARLHELCEVPGEFGELAWTDNQRTLYAGSKDLELEVEMSGMEMLQGEQQLSGISGVDVVQQMSVPEPESAPRKTRIPTAKAVTTGLRDKLAWLKHWSWNAHNKGLRDAYRAAYTDVYLWAEQLISGIGPNFATPLTAYYSLADQDDPDYQRPRILAEFTAPQTLRLSCENEFGQDALALQGAASGFHEIDVGDILHVVRLGCPGYEDHEDRLYVVSGVDVAYIQLTAYTDVPLPQVRSVVAEEFGDVFLIRKIRGAETPPS